MITNKDHMMPAASVWHQLNASVTWYEDWYERIWLPHAKALADLWGKPDA